MSNFTVMRGFELVDGKDQEYWLVLAPDGQAVFSAQYEYMARDRASLLNEATVTLRQRVAELEDIMTGISHINLECFLGIRHGDRTEDELGALTSLIGAAAGIALGTISSDTSIRAQQIAKVKAMVDTRRQELKG